MKRTRDIMTRANIDTLRDETPRTPYYGHRMTCACGARKEHDKPACGLCRLLERRPHA